MTEAKLVLGQLNPSATSLTDIYTVPVGKEAVVSSVVVCNQASTDGTFRVSIAVAGAANNAKQYLYYDIPVPAKDSFVATLGICLGAGDVVRVYASSASFSFNVFGLEVTP